MQPLTVSQVLAAEYREALNDCPPAGCESPGHVVTAPPGVVQSRGTPHFLLQGSALCPRVEVIGPRSCGHQTFKVIP
jgi:hypothetical protein